MQSLFQALGQREQSKKRVKNEGDLVENRRGRGKESL